ncbi:MAG: 5'/3'-nucleotidase SurE, partial [Pseudomonadota bacterium]
VAPESEQSAVGHAITINDPLRVKKISRNGAFLGYGVSGTPADCVKIGVREVMAEPPDLVLSGINLGSNVGINVLYSGTVSAATEGAILGFPSVAVSLDALRHPDFSYAIEFTTRFIELVAQRPPEPGVALSVNVPARPKEEIKGVRLVRQGTSGYVERFEKRVDPREHVYYWQIGGPAIDMGDEGTDIRALSDGYVTVTPIFYDLTHHRELERLRGAWQLELTAGKTL